MERKLKKYEELKTKIKDSVYSGDGDTALMYFSEAYRLERQIDAYQRTRNKKKK